MKFNFRAPFKLHAKAVRPVIILLVLISIALLVQVFVTFRPALYNIDTLRNTTVEDVKVAIESSEPIRYERFYISEENIDYPDDLPIDWNWKVNENRSANFYLHAWDNLNLDLINYDEERDLELLKKTVSIAMDWINSNEFEHINNQEGNFSWYDMAVGVRAYRLAYILEQSIRAEASSDEEHYLMWNSLLDHLEYLKNDENIIFRNNHGIFQSTGQKAIARRYFKVDEQVFSKIIEQSTDRLLGMMRSQFTSEGLHKEHSPAYHQLTYQMFLRIQKEGLLNNSEVKNMMVNIGNALYWMIKPNDYLVNFGDTDSRYIPRDSNRYYDQNSEYIRYYATKGSDGKLPATSIACFEESGFVAVKKEESYLGQQASFHSRTHKHADDLAIAWFDEGQDILIDSGKYGYFDRSEVDSQEYKDGFWYSDPKRMYVERTRAHNTVEIDNSDYDRVHREPYGSALKQCGQTDDGVYFIESEVEHSGGILHNRVLLFNPDDWLIVVDNLTPSDSDSHNYRQWFHFAENLKVTRNGGDLIINGPGMDEEVYVDNLLEDNHSIVGPFTGQKTPYLQGWYSPDGGEFEPAPAVAIEKEQTGATSFATLLSLSKSVINVSVENSLSDQGGSFRWTEGNINWNLFYTRNESGELQVELSQQY